MGDTFERPAPKDENGIPHCPRCGGIVPRPEYPGAYPGALSRADNATEVCSRCGEAEAMEQLLHKSLRTDWLITGEHVVEYPDVQDFLDESAKAYAKLLEMRGE